MTDILNMRNPRIKLSQGDRLLEVFIAHCPCCGKKHIVMRCNGAIDFSLEDVEKFVEEVRKMIMVAKTLP
jgi:hypothetical protein